ncbi:MAG: TRAP transporter substrate-binding protein DctP [Afipia sp.]|nr:TRAP transporter substrate-binding protein DctP [Afipia sp.]
MTFKMRAGLAAIALLGLVTHPAAAVELVHGSWAPAGDHLNTTALPNAFKAIADATKGEIKWKLVAGGQLADGKGSFQAVQDGLIQGGLGISVFVPNLLPSLNVIYTTIIFDEDVVAVTGAATETMLLNCPSCIEEFKKMNAIFIGGFTGSPYAMYCTSPIKSVTEMKGKRIRATGGASDLFTIAGATAIGATPTEAASLLQRGGMDCVWGLYEWLKVYGYGDFAKNITDYRLGLTGPAIGMMLNRDAWLKFTPEQKKLHLRQAAYVSAEMGIGDYVIKEEAILKEVMSTKNVVLVPADRKEFDELVAKYKAIETSRTLKNAASFGVKDAGSIISAYERNVEKWKKLSPGIGRDIKKFEEAMWREVYEKVDPEKL